MGIDGREKGRTGRNEAFGGGERGRKGKEKEGCGRRWGRAWEGVGGVGEGGEGSGRERRRRQGGEGEGEEGGKSPFSSPHRRVAQPTRAGIGRRRVKTPRPQGPTANSERGPGEMRPRRPMAGGGGAARPASGPRSLRTPCHRRARSSELAARFALRLCRRRRCHRHPHTLGASTHRSAPCSRHRVRLSLVQGRVSPLQPLGDGHQDRQRGLPDGV